MPGTSLALLLALLPAQDAPPQRGSLEDFLRHARAERARTHAELGSEVEGILAELEALPASAEDREAERRRERLLDLGPEAAPLLVGALDPGPKAGAAERFRARQVVLVLRELRAASITVALLEQTATGTVEGRRNALEVLETHPEPDRVAPTVAEMYRTAEGELRAAALRTLARLGGPGASRLLGEALQDEDAAIVDLAIRSLDEIDSPSLAEQVLAVAASERGPKHAAALTAFYTAHRDLLADQRHVEALVALAGDAGTPREHAVALMRRLADLEVELKSTAKKTLEPLATHVNDEMREAALVLLARSKDKGARRTLLEPYDDRVERQKEYDGAYTARGDVYYRIAEYRSAVSDYREAIRLASANSRTSRKPEPWLGLARCYARQKRFKDAADVLDDAPVSLTTLRELAEDPAFAEMLDSKYARAFHLPE